MGGGEATGARREVTNASQAVYRSPNGPAFTLRTAASLEDLDACVALQQETWGYSDLQVVPRNMFVLAQTLGGQVVAAWDEQGRLAGFAMAVAALQPGAPPTPYLHSHMLAVAPLHRNCGLGRALKLWQRDDALGRGIRLMRWTFDPLVAKNAFFNLQRLGATARVYLPDFYGHRDTLPTDRLLAEWRLDAEDRPAPAYGLRIGVPAAGDRGHSAEDQAGLRSSLTAAFAEGWVATGFEPSSDGGGKYLLSRPQTSTQAKP